MRSWIWPLVFLVACARAPVPEPRPAVAKKRAPVVRKAKPVERPAPGDERLLRELGSPRSVVLDLSPLEEYVNLRLAGARHMPFEPGTLERRLTKLDPSKTYLLYCSTGARAGKAIHYFRARGLKAHNLGDLADLRARGAPVEGLSVR